MGRPKGSKNGVHRGAIKTCKQCGKEFYVAQNRANKANFCSYKCNGSYYLSHMAQSKKCLFCGQEFITHRDAGKPQWYCSPKCKREMDYKRYRLPKAVTCRGCGSLFTIHSGQSYQTLYCSQACRTKARPFPNRRNGVRRAAIRRGIPMDKCSMCGYYEHPEILTMHHRDLNSKNNAQDNLIPVCPNCHSLVHQRPLIHPPGPSVKH